VMMEGNGNSKGGIHNGADNSVFCVCRIDEPDQAFTGGDNTVDRSATYFNGQMTAHFLRAARQQTGCAPVGRCQLLQLKQPAKLPVFLSQAAGFLNERSLLLQPDLLVDELCLQAGPVLQPQA